MTDTTKIKEQTSPVSEPAPSKPTKKQAEKTRDQLKREVDDIENESLKIFHLCIERAKNLIEIHKAAHGAPNRPPTNYADAFRASVVLSVSALDAFVRSFIAAETDDLIKDVSKPLPGALIDKVKSFVKEDGLFEASRKGDLASRFAKALEVDFGKKSFQGTKNIIDIFRLLGIEDIFEEVSKSADKNYDKLVDAVDEFSNRRHLIAHRGDYKDLKKLDETKITMQSAKDCIELMTLVATHITEAYEKKKKKA